MPADAVTVADLKSTVLLLAILIVFVLIPIYLYLEHLVDRGCPHCEHCQKRIRDRAAEQARLRQEYEKAWGIPPEDAPPEGRPQGGPDDPPKV